MFGLQLPLTRKPHTTFSNPCNKVRGKILLRESSCVVYSCVNHYPCVWLIHCVGMYPAYICIFLHEHVYDNITRVNSTNKKKENTNLMMYWSFLFPSSWWELAWTHLSLRLTCTMTGSVTPELLLVSTATDQFNSWLLPWIYGHLNFGRENQSFSSETFWT